MVPGSLARRWPLPAAYDVRDALLAAWGGAERGYHDLLHLAEVLDRVDELEAAGVRFPGRGVRLAAWFHDGVYDGKPGAEERSAQWAATALLDAGLPAQEADEVARLVRLTEHHRPAAADVAGCVLSDADLAVLASPPQRYAAYVTGVRWEYRHVPDEAFRSGRAAVLRDLARRRHLFHTHPARQRWEELARANLTAELASLAEPGG